MTVQTPTTSAHLRPEHIPALLRCLRHAGFWAGAHLTSCGFMAAPAA